MTGSQISHHHLTKGEMLIADLADVTLAGPSGVVWSLDSPQLNANLVTLRPGDEIGEHVNDEVDVLMVTESGGGEVVVDDVVSAIGSASVILIPQGSRRVIRSAGGLAYYSIHQRRGGLSVGL